MALRKGRKGQPVAVETLPPDEQPYAEAVEAVPLTGGRDRSGRLKDTATARAMAKLPRRTRYLPRAIASAEAFQPHDRARCEYQRRRLAELHAAFGHVSHGVRALVNAEAWFHAGAEFACAQAAERASVELFRQSAQLSAVARQHGLAAWELASREANVARDSIPEEQRAEMELERRRARIRKLGEEAHRDRLRVETETGGGSGEAHGAPASDPPGGENPDADDADDFDHDADQDERDDGLDPSGKFHKLEPVPSTTTPAVREPWNPFVNRFDKDGSRSMTGMYDRSGRPLRSIP